MLYSNISGLNQLLWYYADLEKKKCLDDMYSRRDTLEGLMHGRRSNKVNNVTARKQRWVSLYGCEGEEIITIQPVSQI